MEGLIISLWKEVLNIEITAPIPRISYDESLRRFGLDAPDMRYGLELEVVTDIFEKSGFKVFQTVASTGGLIQALKIPQKSDFTRSEIDEFTSFVGIYGAKGLAYIKILENEWQSPIAKFLSDDEKQQLQKTLGFKAGDIVFFGAGTTKIVNDSLGNLRGHSGQKLGLCDPKKYNFVWVVDFPLFD